MTNSKDKTYTEKEIKKMKDSVWEKYQNIKETAYIKYIEEFNEINNLPLKETKKVCSECGREI